MILFAVAMCQISDLIFLIHFVKGFCFLVLVLVHFDKGTCSSFLTGEKKENPDIFKYLPKICYFSLSIQ